MRNKYAGTLRKDANYESRTLYTSQPAPIPMVLPDKCGERTRGTTNLFTNYAVGWNSCLDKIQELNP